MTRPFSALLPVLLIASVLIVPLTIPRTTTPVSNTDYQRSIIDQMRAKVANLDVAKAVALATSSPEFKSKTEGMPYKFNSIFHTWTYDLGPRGPIVFWNSVNVVYSENRADGSSSNVVVTEDPALSQVTSVTIQNNVSIVRPDPNLVTASPIRNAMQPLMQVLQVPTGNNAPATGAVASSPIVSSLGSTSSSGSGISTSPGPYVTGQPDFSLTIAPARLNFTAGASSSSKITVTSLNGFVGSLALIVSVFPSVRNGPSATFNVTSITLLSGASGSSTLTISSTPFTLANTYTLNVTAVSGTIIHSAFMTAGISADFTMSATPPSPNTFLASQSATSTINMTSFGLSGSVNLFASASPSGPTGFFNPSPVSISPGLSNTTVLTISTTASTSAGNYAINVTAVPTATGVPSHSIILSIKVTSDFTISPNPSSMNFKTGNSADSTITLFSYGLTDTVTLTESVPPATGLTGSLSTSTVSLTPGSSGTSTLTVATTTSTPSGTYTITINGTGTSLSHTTSITVGVCNPFVGTSSVWSGYELKKACFTGDSPVYEAEGNWTVPGASQPPSGGCGILQHCDIDIFAGLANAEGGSTGFVIAGTDSGVSGCPGCTGFYNAFYQFGSSHVNCPGISPGDSVGADVVNYGPKGNVSKYDAVLSDMTKHGGCGVIGGGLRQGTPYFADFIGARPSFDNTPATLPKFDQVTISMCAMNSNLPLQGTTSCFSAYQAGWYDQDQMNNGELNISVSTINPDSSFIEAWLNSTGT